VDIVATVLHQAGQHLLRIRHLRHAFRVDERGDFDPAQTCSDRAFYQGHLVGGADHRRLVLQAIPRTNLDDFDGATQTLHPHGGCRNPTALPARLCCARLDCIHRKSAMGIFFICTHEQPLDKRAS